jgi:exonuclease SbcC
MNKERSLKLIEDRFSAYVQAAPELYKAEARHGDRVRGVYFFDFSGAVTREDFDLSAFLQKHLAPDYYQNEGSLQWNYYLYFVVQKEAFKVLESTGRIPKIELDRTFARKFVRDEQWFIDDLNGNLSATLFKEGRPKDIASHWVDELNKAGLGKIADLKTAYAKIVDDVIKGKSPAVAPDAPLNSTASVEDGKFLKTLKIESFRKHPALTDYEFGQVNLIRGVNGSGKTSLLEAIELGICGGIRRQGGKIPPNSSLLLGFEGVARATKAPLDDPTHYRTIDAAWYGGYYRKVNKLYENFGRFNFFDADAGFRLSHGESAEAIREAIEALFLGEYANSLETIMERCSGEFEAKQRELRQRVASLNLEQGKLDADLATVRKIKNTADALSEELKSKCEATGWSKIPKKLNQPELIQIQERMDSLAAQLASILNAIHWLPKLSIDILNKEQSQLKSALKAFTAKNEVIETNLTLLQQLEENVGFSTEKINLLERLAAYHSEEDALKLAGISESLSAKKVECDSLKEAVSLTKSLDLAAFANGEGSVEANIDAADAKILARKKAVNQKRRSLEALKTQQTEVKAIVEQIRGLGKHLCEQNPDLKDCPLCSAFHPNGLFEQIEKTKSGKSVDQSLRQLTSDLANEEKLLAGAQTAKVNLEHIFDAAKLLLSETQVS